jgi:hypothetical protein
MDWKAIEEMLFKLGGFFLSLDSFEGYELSVLNEEVRCPFKLTEKRIYWVPFERSLSILNAI